MLCLAGRPLPPRPHQLAAPVRPGRGARSLPPCPAPGAAPRHVRRLQLSAGRRPHPKIGRFLLVRCLCTAAAGAVERRQSPVSEAQPAWDSRVVRGNPPDRLRGSNCAVGASRGPPPRPFLGIPLCNWLPVRRTTPGVNQWTVKTGGSLPRAAPPWGGLVSGVPPGIWARRSNLEGGPKGSI